MQTEVAVRCSECGDVIPDNQDVYCEDCRDSVINRLENEIDELRYNYDEMEVERDAESAVAASFRDLLSELVSPITQDPKGLPGYIMLDGKQEFCVFCLTHWNRDERQHHDPECPVYRAQCLLGY